MVEKEIKPNDYHIKLARIFVNEAVEHLRETTGCEKCIAAILKGANENEG
jgi:hypothetical protein